MTFPHICCYETHTNSVCWNEDHMHCGTHRAGYESNWTAIKLGIWSQLLSKTLNHSHIVPYCFLWPLIVTHRTLVELFFEWLHAHFYTGLCCICPCYSAVITLFQTSPIINVQLSVGVHGKIVTFSTMITKYIIMCFKIIMKSAKRNRWKIPVTFEQHATLSVQACF